MDFQFGVLGFLKVQRLGSCENASEASSYLIFMVDVRIACWIVETIALLN